MNFVEQITNYITRPARERYHINRLGPTQIILTVLGHPSSLVLREDSYVINHKGYKVVYSFYYNRSARASNLCIVYLHANNGSRVEGLPYLEAMLCQGYNVCLMDFSGSGISEGEHVSLGPRETEDLRLVIQDLKKQRNISKVVLWGRSMGACTALMYSNKYPVHVAAIVLDSPFKDLRTLVKETASERTGLPAILFEPILKFVDNQLERQIGTRFQDYEMTQYLQSQSQRQRFSQNRTRQFIPAFFLTSKQDNLVKSHHVEALYDRYYGIPNTTKFLYYIQNEHHQARDNKTIERCLNFINLTVSTGPAREKNNLIFSLNTPKQNRFTVNQKSVEQSQKFSFKSQKVINHESSFSTQRKGFCFFPSSSTKDEVVIQKNGLIKADSKSIHNLTPKKNKRLPLTKYQNVNQSFDTSMISKRQNIEQSALLSFRQIHKPSQMNLNSGFNFNNSLQQQQFSVHKQKHSLRSTIGGAQPFRSNQFTPIKIVNQERTNKIYTQHQNEPSRIALVPQATRLTTPNKRSDYYSSEQKLYTNANINHYENPQNHQINQISKISQRPIPPQNPIPHMQMSSQSPQYQMTILHKISLSKMKKY